MPSMLHLVLLVFSFVCFIFDGWFNAGPTKISCFGAAFFVASTMNW